MEKLGEDGPPSVLMGVTIAALGTGVGAGVAVTPTVTQQHACMQQTIARVSNDNRTSRTDTSAMTVEEA